MTIFCHCFTPNNLYPFVMPIAPENACVQNTTSPHINPQTNWINNKDILFKFTPYNFNPLIFKSRKCTGCPDAIHRTSHRCPQFSKDVVRGRLHSVIDRYRWQVSTTLPCSMHVPQKCWHGNELAYSNPRYERGGKQASRNYRAVWVKQVFISEVTSKEKGIAVGPSLGLSPSCEILDCK